MRPGIGVSPDLRTHIPSEHRNTHTFFNGNDCGSWVIERGRTILRCMKRDLLRVRWQDPLCTNAKHLESPELERLQCALLARRLKLRLRRSMRVSSLKPSMTRGETSQSSSALLQPKASAKESSASGSYSSLGTPEPRRPIASS